MKRADLRTMTLATLCAVLCGLGSTVPALAADAGAGDHAVVVGRWDEGGRGSTVGVAVSGTIAYINAGRNLKILDVSSPASPVLLSRLELSGISGGGTYGSNAIFLAGHYAYVPGGGYSLLNIVDVSDPRAPRVAGSYGSSDTSSCPVSNGVVVSGSVAYISDFCDGSLLIVDVSNPASPVELGSYPGVYFIDIAIAGSYLYGVDGNNLRILDVSSPAAPTPVGEVLSRNSAYSIAVAGSYAYLGDFEVLDVSNPADPRTLGTAPVSGEAMAAHGAMVYVLQEDSLHVVDVSDPATPTEVGTLAIHGRSTELAVSGTTVYIGLKSDGRSEGGGLVIVDVSNPALPRPSGSYLTPPGAALRVVASGTTAFVGDAKGALRVVDASNPAAPTEVGTFSAPLGKHLYDNYQWHFAVSEPHVYFGEGEGGLHIVDVSTPSAPAERSLIPTGYLASVALSGSNAFLADAKDSLTSSLRVADVSDPAAPVQAGSLDLPARGVAASGSYAYVSDPSGKLHIVDVSNPAAPAEVGSYPIFPNSVAVDGAHVYAAEFSGLRILDASNPSAPALVGSYDLPNAAMDMAVESSLAYVVEFNPGGGLRILDVSNPAAITEVGSYPIRHPWGVSVAGPYIYVAALTDGLYVLARDRDNDKVGDPTDACPDSILTASVLVEACDSGVPNAVLPDGCTIADRIGACFAGASNHGQSVSCVARTTNQLKQDAVIDGAQSGRIQKCAAQAGRKRR